MSALLPSFSANEDLTIYYGSSTLYNLQVTRGQSHLALKIKGHFIQEDIVIHY